MNTEPLPPCPFCGTQVDFITHGINRHFCHCSGCGANIPKSAYHSLCAAMENRTYLPEAQALRWQMRQVLEFYHTPPRAALEPLGARYTALVEAWRLTEERL
jgi:hypothetical protein